METLIGFAVGYVVGTQQGKEWLRRMQESIEALRSSEDVRAALVTGASIAGSAVRQVLGSGAGAVASGAADALVASLKRR
jgi:hypothetical protein